MLQTRLSGFRMTSGEVAKLFRTENVQLHQSFYSSFEFTQVNIVTTKSRTLMVGSPGFQTVQTQLASGGMDLFSPFASLPKEKKK